MFVNCFSPSLTIWIQKKKFKLIGLHPTILDNVIRMQYSEPTPIQKNAIPLIRDGYDLMACAQTGSGKTAAYLLPILSKVLVKVVQDPPIHRQPGARRSKAAPLALIVLPTRELAIQIFDDTRRVSSVLIDPTGVSSVGRPYI